MVDSHKRIAGAFLIGGALVATAFFLSRGMDEETQMGTVVEAGAVRSYIDIEDENGDGVPDWRDALIDTEPIVIDQSTSTYERPKTVTGKYAINFLEDFLRSKTHGVFGDSQEELVAHTNEELAESAIDTLFTEEDITIVETEDSTVLKAYGNHIATIALSASASSENEVLILQDTLQYNKPERLEDLDPIAADYVNIVKQMLEAPVPAKYAKEHLDLLNAYNAIREDIKGMQKLYSDPMYTFIRLKRYEDDVLGMSNAVKNLYDALYLRDKIEWTENEPASRLLGLIRNI
jgi:hypothetical protein